MVFLTVCAVVSGAECWKDIKQFGDEKIEWLRQYRPYRHGIPVDDTIARLIRAIEPEKMNQAFIRGSDRVAAITANFSSLPLFDYTLTISHVKLYPYRYNLTHG
ncbi:ISAs1 family transposase [Salmonella enterica subsp. diarizonae]|nr:ISAs1 family transposase [Salmonella enterica subsp. diarizonae]ECF5951959.1 ISAs1 family transposase [Salmonella enterica subsp. diarizonae]